MREVQYLYPQPGLTNPITLSTQGIKHRLISVIYWLLNGWGPMRAQAGQQKCQTSFTQVTTIKNANSCWCQHVTTTWQQQLTWTEQMKQNENKMVDKDEDWHDECETEWNNMDKQNKPNTATQKMARRIRSDIQKSLFLEILHFPYFTNNVLMFSQSAC